MLNALVEHDGVIMVTTTAPGVDAGLAWDRALCTHPPDVKCGGPIGCRIVEHVANAYNAQFQANLSKCHRATAARAARRYGSGPLILLRATEKQQRGVYHAHVCLDGSTPRAAAKARYYAETMNELGSRYWLGGTHLDLAPGRKDGKRNGGQAAMYASKYVSKAIVESRTVSRPAFVGHHLTKESGVTMRSLRWRRFIFVRHHIRPASDELSVWIELLRCFPGLEVLPSRGEAALPPPH